MAQLILIVAYMAGCAVLVMGRARVLGTGAATLRGRARIVGPGICLLLLALAVGGMFTPAATPIFLLLAVAGFVVVVFPAFTEWLVPLGLVALALSGLDVVRLIVRATSTPFLMRYPVVYGLTTTAPGWTRNLILPELWAFLIAGCWLIWRRMDPHSRWTRLLLWERPDDQGAGRRPRWGLLLLPAMIMIVEMNSLSTWFGASYWSSRTTIVVTLIVLAVIVLLPAVAADLALAVLIGLGLYGVIIAAAWPAHLQLPSPYTHEVRYGAIWVIGRPTAVLAGVEGLVILAFGVWLTPRAIDPRTRSLFWPAPDAVLAERVERLTQTRAEAVDTAAAELRRVERDLHDGAQARLVALGMSLRAAERVITTSPQAALELIAEARASSSKALTELRDLVRGIYPPVLADRGLADAVRALALDTPLYTEVDIDLPGRPDPPVESACYFAVAEALTNAVRHAGARRVQISIRHAQEMLRIEVTDDGPGGADPAKGSGLRGLERRLAAFDGILAVSSPPGGPTMIVIEVPCALPAPKAGSR
ncbi:MAG TPA: histidine kinase [Streptosporangiaceae bacterium]